MFISRFSQKLVPRASRGRRLSCRHCRRGKARSVLRTTATTTVTVTTTTATTTATSLTPKMLRNKVEAPKVTQARTSRPETELDPGENGCDVEDPTSKPGAGLASVAHTRPNYGTYFT